jgi:HSP20 family protein
MRYRRSSYRYATVVRGGTAWEWGSEIWLPDRFRLLAQGRWRPDADALETAAALEVVVDLAGVDEDDFEVHLFEDVLVVEGTRRIPLSSPGGSSSPGAGGTYHAAGIRQGPFRVELALPARVDGSRVEAHYDRGLLRISLPKPREAT